MTEIEKLDDELYRAMYGHGNSKDFYTIWGQIKSRTEILREAVKIKRNKWDNGDLVKGLTICDAMLADFDSVDQVAYNELIHNIYTNLDIARISRNSESYLLKSLWNDNLKLTEEQKAFVVNEAMNRMGTTRYENNMRRYSKELDEKGITDEQTMYTEFGGQINPVGAKTGNMYMANPFGSLSPAQVHGTGEFDIRYWILRNPNWTLEEKQKLIMDFWDDDSVYDSTLEQWEWGVVNDKANYKDERLPQFDKAQMYEYTYEELLAFYGNKETTDRIWDEIQFCKQMHKLRPQQWEREYLSQRQLVKVY